MKEQAMEASTNDLIPTEYRVAGADSEVRICQRGPNSWAVVYCGLNLNKDGGWEYEGMPSGRTEEFFARCRYPSAFAALEQFKKSGI